MKHSASFVALATLILGIGVSTSVAEVPNPDEVAKVHEFIRGCRSTVCDANARIGQDALTRCRNLGGLEFLIQSVDQELAKQKRELKAVTHEPGAEAYSVARELEESIDQLTDYRKRLARRHAQQSARHFTKLGEERRVPRTPAVSGHGRGLVDTIDQFLAKGKPATRPATEVIKPECKPAPRVLKPVITDRDCLPILNHTIIRWRCGK